MKIQSYYMLKYDNSNEIDQSYAPKTPFLKAKHVKRDIYQLEEHELQVNILSSYILIHTTIHFHFYCSYSPSVQPGKH